ncbi:glycosyltransferase family 4 protein [Patescibacteria group bacterium]
MIIGIDGNEANFKNRVGVNQYGYELLCSLRKLQDKWKYKHKIIVFLRKKPLDDMPKPSEYFDYKVLPGKKYWIIKKLTPYLIFNKDNLDIFFSPSHYVPLLSRVPRVCSIMDLGYLDFSAQFKKFDFWQLKTWTAYSIFVSKVIISISNSTKKDIMRRYPFASNKTKTALLAYDKDKFNTQVKKEDVRRIRKRYSIVDDYILFLSTLKPSKNIEGLIEAFNKLIEENNSLKDIKLVIAGKKGWLYKNIFKKVEELKLKEKIIFTDFIDEKDKPALFVGAKLFILPSFWEGFGLDVLNAMACGVPVVVSDKGSFPEVAGEAGVYIDPYSTNDIADGLKKVLLANEIEYNTYRKKCLEQAKKFSWKKTALKTLEILESAKK